MKKSENQAPNKKSHGKKERKEGEEEGIEARGIPYC
jgi:hypothetical protein